MRYKRAILTWIVAWGLMSFLMLSMYNSMAESFVLTEEFLNAFPEAMREAFAIDIDSFSTPEGFIATELLTLYVVGVVIFITNHLITLQDPQTVLVPLLRPIRKTRTAISNLAFTILETFLINAFFVVITIFAQAIFTDKAINWDFYLAAMMGANIVTVSAAGIILLISSFAKRSLSVGISMIYPIISLIIDGVAALEGIPDFLKYLSLFYYFNLKKITSTYALDWNRLIYLLGAFILTSILGILMFRRKDIDL